jgi:hypothetical protein
MNALRTIVIVMICLLSAQMVLGQAKDEGFSGTDPVKAVQVYPNPTTEFLTIKFESPVAKKAKFTVHNIIGNEIEIEHEVMDEYEVRIRVKDLHEGYYFLSVQSEHSIAKSTYKFLKR